MIQVNVNTCIKLFLFYKHVNIVYRNKKTYILLFWNYTPYFNIENTCIFTLKQKSVKCHFICKPNNLKQ